MSSRREYLRAAFALPFVAGTAGCLATLPGVEEAVVSYKAIEVRWLDGDGRGHVATLCWLWSDGDGRVFGWKPLEYPDIVRSATDVRVAEETGRLLQDRFDGVEFVVGFSSPNAADRSLLENDRGQVRISRRTFDRLQLGDRATLSSGGSGLRILSIEEGPRKLPDDWRVEVRPKDLREQFPDLDVPEP
ncbi:MAG: hypothetical protein V5A46_06980 [Haloferacaceae archaeon]